MICAILVATLAFTASDCQACTTVVVSGKVTEDGRPLLWKNRDAWQRQNEVLWDDTGVFAFVGVANAEATQRIRMGTNTAGFCIENSVSRDLASSVESGPSNGELIGIALRTCKSVKDFQSLLDRTNEVGRSTRGNFGVIDAYGGAMMFEVGPNSYAAFDANDPDDAPLGYIVRANFSETAIESDDEPVTRRDSAYSIERYTRADELCSRRLASGPINLQYLLTAVARDVAGCPASAFVTPLSRSGELVVTSINTGKTLNRCNTVSAVVFHGVKPGESPTLTTMWTLLGEPMFTIAVPCWAKQGGVAPQANGRGASELCERAVSLRSTHYDFSGKRLDTRRLQVTTRKLLDVEKELMRQVDLEMARWRISPPSGETLRRIHESAAQRATETLRTLCEDSFDPNPPKPEAVPIGIDFTFDEPGGTLLGATSNVAGTSVWDGGLDDCAVADGVFRIRRNKTSAANRYVDLSPRIRVSGYDLTYQGYLVVQVRGWNLRGKTIGEEVRFGFSSQGENNFQTAGMLLRRTSDNEVTLSGIAFGDGSTSISSTKTFPARQITPVTFVLAMDKTKGNPGEGDAGGAYEIFFREQDDETFTPLGQPGTTRRSRNGNQIHLRTAGLFAARDEYFDIDRIYFATISPL
ncbi:MAG: hypothetical protein KDB00_10035 [Planctomycetales bacterium]|nr:hypothetical protein [Planctomycetales bacterium]